MFNMRHFYIALTFILALSLSSCASFAGERLSICDNLPTGDVCAYDSKRDAETEVQDVLRTAKKKDKLAVIVMGANWCHDSRALAGQFSEGRVAKLIDEKFELTYVDVGQKSRNLEIAKSFGLPGIVGTPTIIVTDSNGSVLNLDTAPTWRNAASRSESEIYEYFKSFSNMK